MENFLQFWSRYNASIIQILVALVLVTVVFLAFRTFFGNEEGAEGAADKGGLNLGDLEKTLQKVLESQQAVTAQVAASAPAAGGNEESEKLRTLLAEKEKMIAELKSQPAAPAEGSISSEEKKKIEERMKDLEARLAEYEIISEDIADLSFYKEENAKLQKELDALKTGAPVAAAAAAVAPDAPVEAPQAAPVAEAPVAASIAEPTPVADTAPAVEPLAADGALPVDPFEAALASMESAPPPAVESTPAAVGEPAAAAPLDAAPVAPLEVAAAAEEVVPLEASAPAAKEEPPAKSEEPKTEPTAVDVKSVNADELLKEMAEAAAGPSKPATSDDSQLMNQFEDFVKKG